MHSHDKELAHDVAHAVFELRRVLGEARSDLDEDSAVARPLFTAAISDTPYWDDALLVGEKRARTRLQEALICARHLMYLAGSRHGTELGTLAAQIVENVLHVLWCLRVHGEKCSNDDRIAARYALETPWQLSGIAIRQFILVQKSTECANLQENGVKQ